MNKHWNEYVVFANEPRGLVATFTGKWLDREEEGIQGENSKI